MATTPPFYKPAPFFYTDVAQRGFVDPRDIMRWTPQGYMSTALDMKNEPLRTYSWYGVRGSSKYPMGKAFPEPWEIDGWDFPVKNSLWLGLIIGIIVFIFLKRSL